MKILYVTSEANPFAASGGLGDVMGALPKEIAKHGDTEVSVILPLYSQMKDIYRKQLVKVCDLNFNLSWRSTGATVYKIESDNVTFLFIENHYYFDRSALYGEYDDGERFAFFSLSVVEYMLKTGDVPNILHANDWQSALTVIYLKTRFANVEGFSGISTLYTIHNIEYQGKYDMAILGDVFALDNKYSDVVEFDGIINLMKGAITVSDFVSTVSPNYARELQYDFFSFGLSDIIKKAEHKMTGIINGIDYSYFSPDLGGDIIFPYTKRAYKTGKAKNKRALQQELGFDIDPDIPLVVMITRLAAGKGIDLVLYIIERLLNKKVQFALLGTGESEYEAAFLRIQEKYSNFKALIKFDRVISKKMYASADFFLMPSKSEPCGLAQMISCSYGTVPIVREVGGLFDSIIPYGADGSNGFTFANYNADELYDTIIRALDIYHNKEEWNTLVKRAINSDFSWSISANKYISLYENLIKI